MEDSEQINPIRREVNSSLSGQKQEELNREQINELIEHIVSDFLNEQECIVEEDYDLFDKDSLFEDAARLIVQNQIGSISLLQRRMKFGYNRARRIMDQLEKAGIVGTNMGSNSRDVLIKTTQELETYLREGVLPIPNINKRQFYEKYKSEIEARIPIRKKEIEDEKTQIEKDKIKKKILEKERKRQIQKDALNELVEEGLISTQFTSEDGRRESIPQDVMDSVWNRDGGRCVKCGSQENLEFDHIIPFSKGGATTYRNLQILCKKCNGSKSNNIG
jgi:transcriptional regulator NrdR family protein